MVSASQFYNPQQNPLQIVGPGGEAICEKICLIRVICGALAQLLVNVNPAFQAGLHTDFQIHRHMAQLPVAPCHEERTERNVLPEQILYRAVVLHLAARPQSHLMQMATRQHPPHLHIPFTDVETARIPCVVARMADVEMETYVRIIHTVAQGQNP